MTQRNALIIGASGSIGRAIAAAISNKGFGVALVGRDTAKLDQTRAQLNPAMRDALIIPCDVTDREQVKAMVDKVLGRMTAIDILIYAAGTNVRQRSLRSLDPADWDHVISANLTGAYNVMHFVLPSMRTRGGGLVIQISSLSGLRANIVSGVAYSVAKFGQNALGITVGREERGRGIRSTVICAGEVNTEFLAARAARAGQDSDDGRSTRILQPQDIAAAVCFLAELPETAHVPELVIKPTIDDFS
jgi:NADP-dependent 3-hydroxy acid dehydrogenase YdfG